LFGQENYSLSFDGVDDYVNCGTNIDLSNKSFSLSAWVKKGFNDFTGAAIVMSTGNGTSNNGLYFGFFTNNTPDDYLFFNFYQAEGSILHSESPVNINNDNEWHYIVATYNYSTNERQIFLDGTLVGSDSSSPFESSGTEFSIGITSWNLVDDFNGNIKNPIVWNKALSFEEVQEHIICSPPQDEEGIVGYWNFNEGSGDTVYDISGNGNHGVINGATYSDEAPEQNCDNSSLNEPSIIDQLNQSFDAWNISIDLSSGWNMFGYGCPESYGVAEGLSNHTESIIITKDNNGNVYIPEFDFNGIGSFTPGFGYQIKITEEINDFSLCDWYVNNIPEDNIVSLQEENDSLQAELDSIYGCIDETACNYDETAFLDDGSCYNNDLGCGCDTPGLIEGFDCDGNELQYQVGGYAEGGIVFYLDETGEHGLVAAMEDLTEGATIDSEGNPGYQWGCFAMWLSGADGQDIGTGYQNTLDIVAGCSETPIAASEALAYESDDYSDWYLPSLDELNEMYNTIGTGGSEGNIGGFSSNWYWSSSESNNYGAYDVNFGDGSTGNFSSKTKIVRVRVIRSF